MKLTKAQERAKAKLWFLRSRVFRLNHVLSDFEGRRVIYMDLRGQSDNFEAKVATSRARAKIFANQLRAAADWVDEVWK